MTNTDHKALIQSDAAKRQISLALPDHINTDRYSRAVLSAINKTPKLLNCSQHSFVNAVMQCAELGLEPNGRDAHFIPYGSQCQLVVDYKGLIKLAYQSGQVSSINADTVYEGDLFDFLTCEHIPWGWRPDAPAERGNCLGAYVTIDKKDGSVHRERMTFDEIEAIRKRSKAGTSGPWVTDWDEMAKKTVFRRATKWIQLSPHIDTAIDFDHDTPDFDAERRGSRRVVSTEDLLAKPDKVAEEVDSDAIDHEDLES